MRNRIASISSVAIFCLMCCHESQAAPVRWEISAGGNGHWYEAISSPGGTWVEAQNAVSSMSGSWYLATITSQQENAFILNLFQGDPDYWMYGGHSNLVGDVYAGPWIGAMSSSLSSNDWTWATGEAFSYADWGPYEPFGNGDRVYFSQFGSSTNIGWNDAPSYYSSPAYIIETESAPVPIPSTLLLLGSGLAGFYGARKMKSKS